MKFNYLARLLLMLIFAVAVGRAQSHPQPNSHSNAAPQAAATAQSAASQAAVPANSEELRQLEYDLNTLRARLYALKSQASGVADASTRAALMTNADMWELVIADMQLRVDRMKVAPPAKP
jgi:hypothetical protein